MRSLTFDKTGTLSCSMRWRQKDRQQHRQKVRLICRQADRHTGRSLIADETDKHDQSGLRFCVTVVSCSLNEVSEKHVHTYTPQHLPLQPETIVHPGGARGLNEASPVNWVNQPLTRPSLIWDTICMDGYFNKTQWGDHCVSPSVTVNVRVYVQYRWPSVTQWASK